MVLLLHASSHTLLPLLRSMLLVPLILQGQQLHQLHQPLNGHPQDEHRAPLPLPLLLPLLPLLPLPPLLLWENLLVLLTSVHNHMIHRLGAQGLEHRPEATPRTSEYHNSRLLHRYHTTLKILPTSTIIHQHTSQQLPYNNTPRSNRSRSLNHLPRPNSNTNRNPRHINLNHSRHLPSSRKHYQQ